MGYTDIPPPGTPSWVVPATSALLANGVFFWLISYVLMIRRSLSTNHHPIPLLALGLNLAWEVIYGFYVAETALERLGFIAWLLFDIPVLYVTFRTAPNSFRTSPVVKRNIRPLLFIIFAWGLWANYVFARWWMEVPDRGAGEKLGKFWRGRERYDTTELAWWTAGTAQLVMSVGSLAMVLQRGHSGGQSYGIWATRFLGTISGLPCSCILAWYYWPDPHSYVFTPLSFIIVGTSLVCDALYPFALAYAKAAERTLPDGTIVASWEMSPAEKSK